MFSSSDNHKKTYTIMKTKVSTHNQNISRISCRDIHIWKRSKNELLTRKSHIQNYPHKSLYCFLKKIYECYYYLTLILFPVAKLAMN